MTQANPVFFNPVGLITATGWTCLGGDPNNQRANFFGLGNAGDSVATHSLPGKRSYQLKFVNYEISGSIYVPKIGVSGGVHVDNIGIDWDQEWPVMTVNAHDHESATPGTFAHAAVSTYTSSLTVACGFGTLAIETLVADASILSAGYKFSAKHIDIIVNGLLVASENNDGEESFSITTHDEIDPTAIAALADALLDTHGYKLSNVTAKQGGYSVVKHIARD